MEDGGRVRLTARSEEGRALVTTIPAEDGWAAFVDGEQVETGIWLNAFLTLDLPAGEHAVELRYTPPGLIPGAALGGVSVLVLTLSGIYSRRKQRKR